MSDIETRPLIRHHEDVTYEPIDAAEGLRKGVLLNEDHGAPNVAIRRFTLAPGGEVPAHTNNVEHEQYVLSGEYVVGIEGTPEASRPDGDAVDESDEFTVSAGDAIHIPAGAVHWYRNDSEEDGTFLCAVPTGNDDIQLVED